MTTNRSTPANWTVASTRLRLEEREKLDRLAESQGQTRCGYLAGLVRQQLEQDWQREAA